jgi:lipoate-protein ligase A
VDGSDRACRIIVDGRPARGPWNMGVDEALLESAVQDGACTVRVYEWEEPTVSLGYFQSSADVEAQPLLAGLSVVRRLSGGGAIVHHHELTYSCCLAADHPLAVNPTPAYGVVHRAVIALLSERGVTASLRGGMAAANENRFLCFGRGDPHDVVVAGHKVLGSAQRRRRGAILQHGSLLLARSAHAPEYPGLRELAGLALKPREVAGVLAQRLAVALGRAAFPASLSENEMSRAEELQRAKYSDLDWGGAAARRSMR